MSFEELETAALNLLAERDRLVIENMQLREAVGNLLNDNSPQNREDVYALLEVKE